MTSNQEFLRAHNKECLKRSDYGTSSRSSSSNKPSSSTSTLRPNGWRRFPKAPKEDIASGPLSHLQQWINPLSKILSRYCKLNALQDMMCMARMFSCPLQRTCQLIITKPANQFSLMKHLEIKIAKNQKNSSIKGEARRDDQIKAVWFAAGTAVLIACIERATVVSLFAHWRVWAFIVLNLLLLAILFTSKSLTSSSNHSTDTQYGNADPELDKKKKMQPWQPHVSTNVIALVQRVENETNIKCGEDGKVLEEAQFEFSKEGFEDGKVLEGAQFEFSKEELNQRVENFIAMFRQHLVSDSKSSCVHPKQHQGD